LVAPDEEDNESGEEEEDEAVLTRGQQQDQVVKYALTVDIKNSEYPRSSTFLGVLW
jgi:hypothetical protein